MLTVSSAENEDTVNFRNRSKPPRFRGFPTVILCLLACIVVAGCGEDESEVTVFNAKQVAASLPKNDNQVLGALDPYPQEWTEAASGNSFEKSEFEAAARSKQDESDRRVLVYSTAVSKMKPGESRDVYEELLSAYEAQAAAVAQVNSAVRNDDSAARTKAFAEYRASIELISRASSKLSALPGYEDYARGLAPRGN